MSESINNRCTFTGLRGGKCKSKPANGILCKKHFKQLHNIDMPENMIVKQISENKKEYICEIDNCILTTIVETNGKYLCYRHR